MTLTGWGRWPRAETLACRPERVAELERALIGADDGPRLAVGARRSYGDQALNGGGRTILMERLDRILGFDPDMGVLVAEAGIRLGDLVAIALGRGLMLPVVPGTGHVTLGGAIANDVHGKNHDRAGSFGDHVDWIDLLTPDGALRRVSPDTDAELFAATIGGCGLTGVIVRAGLRLCPAGSAFVSVRRRRIPDLDGFLGALQEVRDRSTYSVGWIDALARGGGLGRGILETAEPVPAEAAAALGRPRRLYVDWPDFVLSPAMVRSFNHLYFRRVPASGQERTLPLQTFLYPLDAIADWNRMYGKRGFHQFQCVLPDSEAPQGLRDLLERTAQGSNASFLAVIKTMGGPGRGHLSFPMRGVTLALDIPAREGSPALLMGLERITLDHGGRVYLAKDSALSADGAARMYPRLDDFRAVLARVDPDRRMGSDMARRLQLRGE